MYNHIMSTKMQKNEINKTRKVSKAPAALYDMVNRLFHANRDVDILNIESQYGRLDTFCDEPSHDVLIHYIFGTASMELKRSAWGDCTVYHYQRAMDIINSNNDRKFHTQISYLKVSFGQRLAVLYSDKGDMEKSISSYRWFLEIFNRDEMEVTDALQLCENFSEFKRYDYAIGVLEGYIDMLESIKEEEQVAIVSGLIEAYMNYGEWAKAKTVQERLRSTQAGTSHVTSEILLYMSGRIEARRCNYAAAIDNFKEAHSHVQIRRSFSGINMKGDREKYRVDLGVALLKQSAGNEAVAFELFEKELNDCLEPSDREKILIQMGAEYRNLKKWNQSIETLQLCPSATLRGESVRSHSAANKEMAQTYLEQYCSDASLDIHQRRKILKLATDYSQYVGAITMDMHLTHAQLFYFNGNENQAYTHLKQYLDDRLTECKLGCYTCKQRIQKEYFSMTCACCKVALYCDKIHQHLTWKNERICHKVLCPLLRYWRRVRAGKTGEGRCKEVFSSFFENICPRGKTCMPSCYDGIKS